MQPMYYLVPLVLTIYAFLRIGLAHVTIGTGMSGAIPIEHASMGIRLFNLPIILFYYFQTFFFPQHLAISQQWLLSSQNLATVVLVALAISIIFAALGIIGVVIYRQHRKQWSVYLLFALWLVIGLLIHSNILWPLDATVADRWFYFPMVGILGLIGTLMQLYKAKINTVPKLLPMLLAVVLVSSLSIRTIVRNANFVDNITLFSHDIQYSADSSLLQAGLGTVLIDNGRYSEAEAHLVRSIELDPSGYLEWNTLGLLYEKMGKIDEAKRAYMNAVKNASEFAISNRNLGLFLLIYDTPQSAEAFLQKSLQRLPQDGNLLMLYALTEHKLGHDDAALTAARQAALYNPDRLAQVIYERLSQHLSLEIRTVQEDKHKTLIVCPPSNCNN